MRVHEIDGVGVRHCHVPALGQPIQLHVAANLLHCPRLEVVGDNGAEPLGLLGHPQRAQARRRERLQVRERAATAALFVNVPLDRGERQVAVDDLSRVVERRLPEASEHEERASPAFPAFFLSCCFSFTVVTSPSVTISYLLASRNGANLSIAEKTLRASRIRG